MKLNARDIAYFGGLLLGLGIVWGNFTTRVNAQEEAIKPLPGAVIRIAVVETKIDYLIGLLEYKYGLRTSLPSRPRPQDQR